MRDENPTPPKAAWIPACDVCGETMNRNAPRRSLRARLVPVALVSAVGVSALGGCDSSYTPVEVSGSSTWDGNPGASRIDNVYAEFEFVEILATRDAGSEHREIHLSGLSEGTFTGVDLADLEFSIVVNGVETQAEGTVDYTLERTDCDDTEAYCTIRWSGTIHLTGANVGVSDVKLQGELRWDEELVSSSDGGGCSGPGFFNGTDWQA